MLNEQVIDTNTFGTERASTLDIVCECSSAACTKIVSVTLEEYEAVRAKPTCFLIARADYDSKLESVVVRDDRFVVEKRGEAAAIAEQTDPRR